MIKAKLSGNFSSTMQARIERWSSIKISATIVVPPELQWVIFQEFGISPHPIQARNESLLVLPGPVFKAIVEWSPTKYAQGTHTIRTVKASLSSITPDLLKQIFATNQDNPEAVRAGFLETVMVRIKAEITSQMAIDLPGFREVEDSRFPEQAGKLRGRTAAEVFDEQATIVSE